MYKFLYIMNLPSQSADLSPIELFWDKMDRKIFREYPKSEFEFFQCSKNDWESISLQKLLKRMSRIYKVSKIANNYQFNN